VKFGKQTDPNTPTHNLQYTIYVSNCRRDDDKLFEVTLPTVTCT